MKTIAVLAIVATLGALLYTTYNTAPQADSSFERFIATHGRNYASQEEFNLRKGIFMTNLQQIEEHNAKGLSWTLGVNQFSDWTDEEYGRLLGLKGRQGQNSALPVLNLQPKKGADKSIDWRDVPGYVSAVRNQGSCGSCWAFSATQTTEAAYFKKYGKVVHIAESQLVDCDFTSHGCNGGLQENGYIHWMRHQPILDEHYPYVPKDRTCQESTIAGDLELLPTGYRVDSGDDFLYEALTHQPVSLSIRAENPIFRSYKGGIIDGDTCGTWIDHAVLLVGYNAEDNAWIVKNSWGPNWGENGFVRIRRAPGKGICGANQQNSLAVYDEDDY